MSDLYVVSCSAKKVWEGHRAKPYLPAKQAYVGKTFQEFRRYAEAKGLKWEILSGKYGFIEPDHPIGWYDVYLGSLGSIDAESLLAQTVQLRLYRGRYFRLVDFNPIWVVNCDPVYSQYLQNAFPGKDVREFDRREFTQTA